MSLLDIHVLGSPILREETKIVAAPTDELRRLADDMFETMYAAQGIGLAAPQVGRRERLAVFDVGDQPFALFNPWVVRADGTATAEEGCLSIPDVYGDVRRAARVVVQGLDLTGQEVEIEADELLARCLQHEIDHLHGRLFIDHLSVLKRRAALKKWETMREKFPDYIRTLSAEEVAEHHHRDEEL